MIFAGLLALRIALQIRRTGFTGLHRVRGGPSEVGWWTGVIFLCGIALAPLPPVLMMLGVLDPLAALDTSTMHVLGLLLAVAGGLLVFGAQLAMGDSWRIGVEPEERTELVTSGPFRIIRNPIFGAMIPFGIGLALIAPNVVSFAGLLVVAIALELQVRLVEEPYLLDTHGEAYRQYASRVGRFVPGVGLLKPVGSEA